MIFGFRDRIKAFFVDRIITCRNPVEVFAAIALSKKGDKIEVPHGIVISGWRVPRDVEIVAYYPRMEK